MKVKNKKIRIYKLKAFLKSPQKGGTCIKVFVTTPKKPNSALRKVTKVFVTTKKNIIAHIPGEGHTLQKFSTVLCRGCRVRDTPGIKYRVIRGAKKYHLKGILSRITGRSKYGTKKLKKNKQ
jgi:small subunit ribosomal protein S12